MFVFLTSIVPLTAFFLRKPNSNPLWSDWRRAGAGIGEGRVDGGKPRG